MQTAEGLKRLSKPTAWLHIACPAVSSLPLLPLLRLKLWLVLDHLWSHLDPVASPSVEPVPLDAVLGLLGDAQGLAAAKFACFWCLDAVLGLLADAQCC